MEAEWYPRNREIKLDFAASSGLTHRLVAEASYPQANGRVNTVYHELLAGPATGTFFLSEEAYFFKVVM